MIDTLYICYKLRNTEYQDVFVALQSYLKREHYCSQLRKDKTDKNAYVTNAFAKQGLQEIRLRQANYGHKSIEIRLRPKLLVNLGEYYTLTKISDFEDIEIAFGYLIRDQVGLCVPALREWIIQRVDAAVDLHVSKDLIPYYIRLFKKGNIPEYFFDRKTTLKYWDSTKNIYLMAKNITINWYDRNETIHSKVRSDKSFSDYEVTTGVLRFETQVRKADKSLAEILEKNFLKKKVVKFYELIVGTADYYTLDEAVRRVRHSVKRKSKGNELTELLQLINQYGSIFEAKRYYLQGKDKKSAADKFSKRINQLLQLGINPVVLPNEWRISHLKNLLPNIIEEFDKERRDI